MSSLLPLLLSILVAREAGASSLGFEVGDVVTVSEFSFCGVPLVPPDGFIEVRGFDGQYKHAAGSAPGGIRGIALPDGGLLVMASHFVPRMSALRLDAAGKIVDAFDDPDLPWGPFDVASDGCTLFFGRGFAIGRYDICARRRLADFAEMSERPHVVKLLPDGGLIAAAELTIVRLDAAGQVIARMPVKGFSVGRYVSSMSLSHDGRVVWGQLAGSCNGGILFAMDLTTGEHVFLPATTWLGGSALAVVGGWNAAEQFTAPSQRRRAIR